MGYLIKQSSTARPLMFLMIGSTDHIIGKTGVSPTVTISKNGAAFASPAGAVSELSNGWYKVAGNDTDSNTLGVLILNASGTGADSCDDRFEVVAFDPDLAAIGAVMPTIAGRTLDISASGEAGIDWANIGTPTGVVVLSGTTIASTQKVDVETIKTNPVVNAGTVTFPTSAVLASTTNIAAASGVVLSPVTHTGVTIPTVTLVNTLASGAITSGVLHSGALNAISDGILTRNVSYVEAVAGEHTLATSVLAAMEWSISGVTLTIKRTDGSTTHYTKVLSSGAFTNTIITGLN